MINQYAISNPSVIGKTSQSPTGNTFNDNTIQSSYTTTLFFDYFISKSFLLHIDPEINAGTGVGNALGIAGYVNGEVVRVGFSPNILSVSRAYVQYSDKMFNIKLGKFTFTDMFCNSVYSHDPRIGLMNWAMWTGGAWDYCGNTKGYTYGFVSELHHKKSTLKFGVGLEPMTSNGLLAPYQPLDLSISFKNGLGYNLEYDRVALGGKLRYGLTFFLNHEQGAAYSNVVHTHATDDSIIYNVSQSLYSVREFGFKYGGVLRIDCALSDKIGLFSLSSWNDGKREIWAFAEIDRSLCLGAHVQLSDKVQVNAGYSLNGLSPDHADYLRKGGYTFMLGDGSLNYGLESNFELQYIYRVNNKIFLTPDYQFIVNPGYNKDNKPVHVFGLRTHIEF